MFSHALSVPGPADPNKAAVCAEIGEVVMKAGGYLLENRDEVEVLRLVGNLPPGSMAR
jgi:hypothetical protein